MSADSVVGAVEFGDDSEALLPSLQLSDVTRATLATIIAVRRRVARPWAVTLEYCPVLALGTRRSLRRQAVILRVNQVAEDSQSAFVDSRLMPRFDASAVDEISRVVER